MNEVNDIAKAAGCNLVGQVTQYRDAVDSAHCIGRRKLDEPRRTVGQESIHVVIFTRQLSAGQVFRIGKKLGNDIRVLDRNLLILETFEKRSATKEAGLQVALARLRYIFSWGQRINS